MTEAPKHSPSEPPPPPAAPDLSKETEAETAPGSEADPLATATARIRELEDQLLRMQADFDNFRKRLARDRDESLKYANQALLEELLPVVDNFELGLKAAETGGDAKAILMGLQMVKAQLERFLNDQGVAPLIPENGTFDPHQHEAVGTESTTEVPDGTIVSVQRKGYKLKGRLLRPAAVIVAHPPEPAPAAGCGDTTGSN